MTKNFKAIVAAVTLGLFCLTQVGLAMTTNTSTSKSAPLPAPAPTCKTCL